MVNFSLRTTPIYPQTTACGARERGRWDIAVACFLTVAYCSNTALGSNRWPLDYERPIAHGILSSVLKNEVHGASGFGGKFAPKVTCLIGHGTQD